MSDGFTIDEFLDGYEEQRVPAKVCMKGNLVAEHAELDAQLNAAHKRARDSMHDKEVSRLRRAIADIEKRIAESERTFWFHGVGYRAWQDLKRKYPPTKEQREQQGLDLNLETFVVPAIAASAVQPEMSLEQANSLAEILPEGEIQKLFRAVLQANGETLVPKSILAAAIEQVVPSDRSSITAALVASLDQSSSDGSGDQSPNTPATTPDD
jgi:hypothetical protein